MLKMTESRGEQPDSCGIRLDSTKSARFAHVFDYDLCLFGDLSSLFHHGVGPRLTRGRYFCESEAFLE